MIKYLELALSQEVYEYLEELDEMNWSARGNVLNQYLRNTSIGTTVKRLELAIMNVFMYLLVLIIGKSKALFVLRECAVFEFKSGNSAAKFVIWIFNDFFKQVITSSLTSLFKLSKINRQ